MKMFKGKGGDNGISRDHASTSHVGILSYCTTSFALFCHPHMNIKEDWIKDTGASDHMTPNFDLFISITHLKNRIIVYLPYGNSKTVIIVGKVQLTPSLILTNVFYVPEFQLNLLYVGQFTQNHNLSAPFYSNNCCFQDPSTKQIVAVGKGSKCLYICKPTLDPIAFAANISEFQASHLNCIPSVSFHEEPFSNTVSKTVLDVNTFHARLGHTSVSKLSYIPLYKSMDFSNFTCECCMLSKHHRLSFLKSDNISPTPFHLIHVDLWGPYKQVALKDEHYFFTIVDDNTRATWTYLVHTKEKIPQLLVSFFAFVKTHFQRQPKVVRSDNGTGVVNKTCVSFFQAHGVLHQRSIAHTPQQNGRVERKHRHLLDTARAFRIHVKVLDWQSPFEKLYGKPPTYDHLRVIGCLCYVADIRPHKDKFANKGIKSVLIGYPVNQKEPNVSDATTDNIYSSNHVPVNPTTSVPLRKSSRNSTRPAWLQDFVTPKAPSSNTSTPHYPLFVSSEFRNSPHSHIAFLANVLANSEPTSYAQAEKDIKYKPDRKVDGFKARLVVGGFNQKEGLDYKHIFSPVAKLATVRVLITIATAKQWPLHQLDINNAFLHGYIKDEIYILPPEGYTKASPGQVCKLNRSLYGLKQASRQCNHELTRFLVSLGFIQSKHNYSLFIKVKGEEFTDVLVYVDDMLITGKFTVEIQTLKQSLDQQFTIKDLGLAKYFLGIELCKTNAGMHLNQRKYILDLLTDAGLTAVKPSSFPLPTQIKLSLDKGTPLSDAGSYRRFVGRLLYLTMTRPDISYVVQHLSQFVSAPKDVHMQAAIHLLKYLKWSISKGLFYPVQSHLKMTGFSDADWTSCLMTRRSLTAYWKKDPLMLKMNMIDHVKDVVSKALT
ncbi:retrovirus-related pol polyprotein from transposon TNT 1-94 [Tanacetum coccineum]